MRADRHAPPRHRLTLLALILAVPLGVVFWLGLEQGTGEGDGHAGGSTAEVDGAIPEPAAAPIPLDPARDKLPVAEGGVAERLATTTEGVTRHHLAGRVLDEHGAPLAGARVVALVTPAAGADDWFVDAVPGSLAPWETLPDPWAAPSTSTDRDGRFELAVGPTPVAPGVRTRSQTDGSIALVDTGRTWPVLLVSHSDHAPARQDCKPLETAVHDAGTIRLAAGGRVTGRCVDEDGRPVAGVRLGVNLRAQEWPCPAGRPTVLNLSGNGFAAPPLALVDPEDRLTLVRSDEDGRFEIAGLPPGPHQLEAQAASFLPRGAVAVTVLPGATQDVGSLVFRAAGHVAGRVLDERGRPVAGAVVQAAPFRLPAAAGPHQRFLGLRSGHRSPFQEFSDRAARAAVDLWAVSDDDGRFEIVGLPDAGPVALVARAEGLDVTGVEDVPVGTEELTLVLPPARTVELRCVDTHGQPLVLASLQAARQGQPLSYLDPEAYDQQTAAPIDPAAGRWRLEDVCAHPMTLWGRSTPADRHHTARLEDPLGILRDGRLTVVMEAWPQLSARVVDARGDVLVQARARWLDGDKDRWIPLADGVLSSQPPTRVPATLRFMAPGFLARDLEVDGATGLEAGDVPLEPAPRVTVRVLSPQGLPREGAAVALERRESDGWRVVDSASTDGLGLVALSWGLPGEHRVALLRGLDAVGVVASPVLGHRPRATSAELLAPDPRALDIQVIRDGEPVAKARVHALAGEHHRRVRADAAGRATIRWLSAEPGLVWAESGRGFSPLEPLPLTGEAVTLRLDGAALTGQLVGEPSAPGPLRRHVSLVGRVPDHRVGVTSAADGSFRFNRVPGGTYVLEVRRFPDSKEVLTRVEVTHPGPEPRVPVPGLAVVRVRLLGETGEPVWERLQAHLLPEGEGAVREQSCGDDGATWFANVRPGRWRLVITEPLALGLAPESLGDPFDPVSGMVLAETALDLAPGDDRLVELRVPP